jgi:hypothetical protein
MTVENGVRLMGSTVVLVTVALSHPKCPLYVSDNLLFLTALVAAVQLQSVFTGFCPSAILLRKLGMKGAGEG